MSARVFLGEKGLTRTAELEKKYNELCRLREQVQISESRQPVLLRKLDDAGPLSICWQTDAMGRLNASIMNHAS